MAVAVSSALCRCSRYDAGWVSSSYSRFGSAISSSDRRMDSLVYLVGLAEIETNLLNQSRIKPIAWRRYIVDVFSLWNTKREDLDIFITQANTYHPKIKFTAEISDIEIAFLDTVVYKGVRFQTESILDIKTHNKQTETF